MKECPLYGEGCSKNCFLKGHVLHQEKNGGGDDPTKTIEKGKYWKLSKWLAWVNLIRTQFNQNECPHFNEVIQLAEQITQRKHRDGEFLE